MVTSCGEHSKLDIIDKLMCIEALLISILAWLPPKSIFRFKCVSKTWNRILVEPYFLESYYKAAGARNNQVIVGYNGERLLAFIQSNIATYRFPYDQRVDTVTLTQKNYDITQLVPTRFGSICNSYNGLILCKSLYHVFPAIFYIVNPVTRMFVTLPPSPKCSLGLVATSPGLTWEENTNNLVPSYKVVLAMNHNEEKNKLVIHTYCSKSSKWEQSTLIAMENFRITTFLHPLVSNGVFHWYTGREALVVYDSNRDEKHVQLIKCPPGEDLDWHSGATMSSCDGVLWYGKNHDREKWNERKINFWILPKDKLCESYKYATTIENKEWILMHSICIQSFCNYFNAKFVCNIDPYGLRLLGWIPCYPVLAVLGNMENIFLFNLESKCAELVTHRARSDVPCHSFELIPYVESLSLSSYAISTTYY